MTLKKIILASTILFFLVSCKPKYGSLTGNVYWKYNNYVGNKPDEGSTVYLFSADTSKAVLQTTCDVQGNFKFDKIVTGKYMAVIESKNTNTSASDQLYEMYTIDNYKYFDLSFDKIDSTLFNNAMDNYYEVQKKELSAPAYYSYKEKLNYYDSLELTKSKANNLADSLFKKIPKDNRLMTQIYLLGSFAKKKKFKEIDIKENESENIVIDFGLTYY
jgi:hypothetical protein